MNNYEKKLHSIRPSKARFAANLVIIFSLVVVALYLVKTPLPFKLGNLLKKEHPVRDSYLQFEDTYGNDSQLYVIMEKEELNIELPENYAALRRVHGEFQRNRGLETVDSLINAEFLNVQPDRVNFLPFYNEDNNLEEKGKSELNLSFFENRYFSQKGNSFLLTLDLAKNLPATSRNDVLKALLRQVELLQDNLKEWSFYAAGVGVAQLYLFQETIKSQVLVVPVFLFLLSLLVYLLFRSFKTLLLFIKIILLSYSFLIFIIWFFEGGVSVYNGFTLFFVLIIGTSDLVHYFHCFCNSNETSLESKIRKTNEQIWWPCFLTTLTTSFTFLSLTFSSFVPLAEIGLYSSVGSIICFFSTFYILPILIRSTPAVWSQHKYLQGVSFQPVLAMVFRWPKITQALFFSGALVFLFGFRTISVDDRLYDKFSKDHPLTQAVNRLNKDYGFVGSLDLVIKPRDFQRLAQDQIYSFEKQIEEIKGVGHVFSYAQTQQYFSSHFNLKKEQAQRQLGALNDLVEEFNGFEALKSDAEQELRSMIFVESISSKENNRIQREILTLADPFREFFSIKFDGFTAVRTFIFSNIISEAIRSFALSLLSIFVLFLFIFRNLKISLLGLIPNLFPLLFIGGGLSFMGISIENNVVLMICITLGISVDDTIHFLYSLKKHSDDFTRISKEAISKAFSNNVKPLFGTTLIFVLSFPCFMISDLKLFVQVGFFVILSMVIALISDLILLPAILKMMVVDALGRGVADESNA